MFTIALVILSLLFGYWLGRNRSVSMKGPARVKRQQQKKQVVGLFAAKTKITNDDVQAVLNVSDATATRVLDELESDGLITAKGKTSGTYYIQQN